MDLVERLEAATAALDRAICAEPVSRKEVLGAYAQIVLAKNQANPSGWQPIDTAPKAIEFRCLLAHQFSVVTGYWDGNGWVNERSRNGGRYYPATHWMPLPEGPKSRSIVGGVEFPQSAPIADS